MTMCDYPLQEWYWLELVHWTLQSRGLLARAASTAWTCFRFNVKG